MLDEDSSISITLVGSDPDNNDLTFSLFENPNHGQVEINGSILSYTPDNNFFGDDIFSYISNDGEFDSDPASITFHVVGINDSPVAQNIDLQLTASQNLDLSTYINDPDGDDLFIQSVPPGDGVLLETLYDGTLTWKALIYGSL